MSELVSIIVPVYNVEFYIKKCVKSVLSQTYPCFELILIDDGSTDKSGVYCDELAKTDQRVKVLHKKNGGQAEARNIGLDCARGEFIFFLDADDWIEPEAIKTLIDKQREKGADMVCGGYRLVDEGGRTVGEGTQKLKMYSGEEALEAYLKGTAVYGLVCAKLYRKELFYSIRFPAGYIHEDDFIIYKLFYASQKIYALDKILYNYLQRKDSTMHKAFSEKRLVKIDAARELYQETQKFSAKDIQHLAYIRYIDALCSMYVCGMKYLDKNQVKALESYEDEIYRECKKAYQVLDRREISKKELFLISYCPLYYKIYRLIRRTGKKILRGSNETI